LVHRTLLRSLACAGLAAATRPALAVGRTRLALAGLADLAHRTLVVRLALRLGHARVRLPGLACGALRVVAALDALVLDAHLAVLAVRVALAAGLLRLAATSAEHGARKGGDRYKDLVHGLKPKWTQHVSQICYVLTRGAQHDPRHR